MTDWGAVSSWVAAALSLGALGVTVGRSWWIRPQVDWSLRGELKWPNYDRPGFTFMEGQAEFANFGDGPAHRVSVHIKRGHYNEQVLATSPLVKPGDGIAFTAGCGAGILDDTHVWVTWTPPPIRRRREVSSPRFLLKDHVTLSDIATQKLAEFTAAQEADPDRTLD